MILAKPTIFNMNGAKEFDTLAQAKKYLEEVTGYAMPAVEWAMIGKLLKADENGQLIPAVDIPEEIC